MILEQCFHTLQLYGKDVESFPIVCRMFEAALGKYPAKKIRPAFEKFIRHCDRFPAPSDIIAIIEGRIKREPTFYRQLLQKRREYTFLSDREHEYIRKYEDAILEDWDR